LDGDLISFPTMPSRLSRYSTGTRRPAARRCACSVAGRAWLGLARSARGAGPCRL